MASPRPASFSATQPRANKVPVLVKRCVEARWPPALHRAPHSPSELSRRWVPLPSVSIPGDGGEEAEDSPKAKRLRITHVHPQNGLGTTFWIQGGV